MDQPAQTSCPRCGAQLEYGQTACPACGAVTNQRQIDEIAAEATRLEPINPQAAGMVWRRALDMLPAGSEQFQSIERRAAGLLGHPLPPPLPQRAVKPPDPLPLAFAKTLGSMILAAIIYYLYPFHSVTIAIGFVVLMLIHEMGHVFATWYFGLSASPPIFIPYIGALINLRESPPNALVESIIGIGGPLLGTIGAVACYQVTRFIPGPSFAHWAAGEPSMRWDLLVVTQLAVILNLFNLLPVPPLDGGRITAAVSPWIWIAGLAGLAILMFLYIVGGVFSGLFILILLLVFALPRIRSTFIARAMHSPYYQISRVASWTMGVLYVGLGAFLFYIFYHLGEFKLLQAGMHSMQAS